jgi:glycosidase
MAFASPPIPDLGPVPVADPGSTLPRDWHRGAAMQIFVRSYQDSNGDGIGDLPGLTSRLDYLQDLGVRALWLMPITPSQDRDHGYAVTDYRAIEPAYGTLDDFDELLRQAHARGLAVMLDVVINHSAADHPLFEHSRNSRRSPYRDWYAWADEAPVGWEVMGGDPWRRTPTGCYYAGFSPHMPEFDLRNPAVVAFHEDHQRFWFNRGVDGLRFDAVGNLVENGPQAWECQPENYTLMAGMRALADRYENRHIVCEGPGDPQGFAAAAGAAFAFDLNGHVLKAAQGDLEAIEKVSAYYSKAPHGMASFASNHDSFAGRRVWDQLHGDLEACRLVAATILLLPGQPFLYYGEEVGMSGAHGLTGDPELRAPMSWTNDPQHGGFTTGRPYRALAANVRSHNVARASADPDSLLSFYKGMLALRNRHRSIACGRYEWPFVAGPVMGFQRVDGAERTLVLIHYGRAQAAVRVPGLPAGAVLRPLHPGSGPEGAAARAVAGEGPLDLPGRSVKVYEVLQ